MILRILTLSLLSVLIVGCVTSPPKSPDNICSIFKEKRGWYKATRKSEKKWGTPIATQMAFIYQESRFQAKAKPPRKRFLWIFPGARVSDAYGYPQAKEATWDWYKKSGGSWWADRHDFADAVDFVGWYNQQSHRRNKIQLADTYHLYLAYHEGHGGFNRRTFTNKQWLLNTATQVTRRASRYSQQLQNCRKKL